MERKKLWKESVGGFRCLCMSQSVQQEFSEVEETRVLAREVMFCKRWPYNKSKDCTNTLHPQLADLSSPRTYAGSSCKSNITRHLQTRIYSLIRAQNAIIQNYLLFHHGEDKAYKLTRSSLLDPCTLVTVEAELPTQHSLYQNLEGVGISKGTIFPCEKCKDLCKFLLINRNVGHC